MESKKTSRRHHRLAADSDLFSDKTETEQTTNTNKRGGDSEERVRFKIGRNALRGRSFDDHPSSNGVKSNDSISKHSDQQTQDLSESSLLGGISSATTILLGSQKSSQDDMFASQIESSLSNSLNMPNYSSSGVEYDDFMKNSGNSNQLNSSSLESTDTNKNTRTSTPRKRKPEKSLSDSNSKKLQRITEESSPNQILQGEQDQEKSSNPCHNIKSLQSSLHVGLKKSAKEAILLDSQLPDTQIIDKDPDIQMLHTNSRRSLEVLYSSRSTVVRSSRLEKCVLQKSSPKEVFDIEDDEDDHDSYQLCLSQTQTQADSQISSVNEEKSSNSNVKYISIDDDYPVIIGNTSQQTRGQFVSKQHVNGSSLHSSKEKDVVITEILPGKDCIKSLSKKGSQIVHDDNLQDNCPISYSFQKVKTISNQQKLNVSAHLGSPYTKGLNQAETEEVSVPVINIDSDNHETPENNRAGSVETFQLTATGSCVLTWKYSINTQTKEVISREILKFDIDETIQRESSHSDISPGALADVSEQSKNASPSSTSSTVPYILAARQSFTSTVSGSSSSSATSAASMQAMAVQKAFGSMQPALLPRPLNVPPRLNGQSSRSANNVDVLIDKLGQIEENNKLLNAAKSSLFASPYAIKKSVKNSAQMSKTKECGTLEASTSLKNLENVVEKSSSLSSIELDTSQKTNSGKKNKKGAKAPPCSRETEKIVSESTNETPKSSTKKKTGRGRPSARKLSQASVEESLPAIAEVESLDDSKNSKKKTLVKSSSRKLSLPKEVPLTKTRMSDDPKDREHSPVVLTCSIASFARWTDKKYYAAVLLGMKNGRCNVRFDDGKCKVLVEDHVIQVNQLMKGLSVYAEIRENEFEPGLIVGFKVDDGDVLYVVELDSGANVTVSRSAIFMTEDQASILKKFLLDDVPFVGTPRRVADVSMDNICEGKRSRLGSKMTDNQVPGVSGTGEPRLTPKSDVSDTPNSSSEDISGVESENYSSTYPSLRSDGLSKATKSRVKGICKLSTEKSNDQNITDLLGPIPTDSKIFAGMKFLLTCSDKWDYHLATKDDYHSESTSSENEFKSYTTMPFVRQRLTTQLVAGGGTVCRKFEEMQNQKSDTCILIANGPCHTENYILCLANKITIINHEWVIYCSKESKKLPITRFMLPAGFSMEKQRFVEFKDRQAKRSPLKNMDIMLASEMDSFVAFWSKVLETAGARVSSLSFEHEEKPSAEGIDVVVCDHTLTPKMKTWALNFDLTIVTSDWIKQCIINCEKSNIHFHGFQYACFS